jgi:hypothetical protein
MGSETEAFLLLSVFLLFFPSETLLGWLAQVTTVPTLWFGNINFRSAKVCPTLLLCSLDLGSATATLLNNVVQMPSHLSCRETVHSLIDSAVALELRATRILSVICSLFDRGHATLKITIVEEK